MQPPSGGQAQIQAVITGSLVGVVPKLPFLKPKLEARRQVIMVFIKSLGFFKLEEVLGVLRIKIQPSVLLLGFRSVPKKKEDHQGHVIILRE